MDISFKTGTSYMDTTTMNNGDLKTLKSYRKLLLTGGMHQVSPTRTQSLLPIVFNGPHFGNYLTRIHPDNL